MDGRSRGLPRQDHQAAAGAELKAASSYAKLHGDPDLWLQVIEDGFVIMRLPSLMQREI
jgi:hypothetical protein